MIGKIRVILAFAVVAIAAPPMMLAQVIGMKTGWFSPAILPRFFHRMVMRLMGFRIRVVGRLADDRPLLLTPNHVSWIDISVLGSVAGVSFIAKSEMAGWPVFGTFARLQRSIFVERERKQRAGEQASEISRRLGAGDIMVLFAEGTTSDGNMTLPFKSTLFGAASMTIAEGAAETVHIQPVAIAYTRLHGLPLGRTHRPLAAWIGDEELAPHMLALMRHGAMDAEVHFGEPVAFTARSSRKETARLVEDRVRAMLEAALRDPLPGHGVRDGR